MAEAKSELVRIMEESDTRSVEIMDGLYKVLQKKTEDMKDSLNELYVLLKYPETKDNAAEIVDSIQGYAGFFMGINGSVDAFYRQGADAFAQETKREIEVIEEGMTELTEKIRAYTQDSNILEVLDITTELGEAIIEKTKLVNQGFHDLVRRYNENKVQQQD